MLRWERRKKHRNKHEFQWRNEQIFFLLLFSILCVCFMLVYSHRPSVLWLMFFCAQIILWFYFILFFVFFRSWVSLFFVFAVQSLIILTALARVCEFVCAWKMFFCFCFADRTEFSVDILGKPESRSFFVFNRFLTFPFHNSNIFILSHQMRTTFRVSLCFSFRHHFEFVLIRFAILSKWKNRNEK